MTKDEHIEVAAAQQVDEVTDEKGPFHSWHEGLGFLSEEVQEVKTATTMMEHSYNTWEVSVYENWQEKLHNMTFLKSVRNEAIGVAREAIDVICVCDRIIASLKDYDGSLD